ncbi:alpha/beta hydrolase family protein [Salipaludibacillus daqingensis]|uniref:alpha/beta hydrolase family protein n=1 Tax=Salipaludibacillus daqingensis TaxID=3041001 RepID=UPI002474489A|nr:alpha/beta hydrolase [Salipaludibacillus daqingensis]
MIGLEQGEAVKLKMADGMTLSGHLFKPVGLTSYPLIVFVTGSGGLTYEIDWQKENFYFCRTLADICLAEGFALLLVDKRGAGRSEGNWKKQSFYARADDIADVLKCMKQRPDILANQISVVGHSQGGWVVQLLASRHPDLIKSTLSIAGPAYSVIEQMIDNMETDLMMRGYRRLAKWILPLYKNYLILYKTFSKGWKLGYLSYILDYDARETIPNINVPTYFGFAGNDNLVPLEKNEPLAHELLAGVKVPYYILIAPGVNHGFALSGKYQSWDEIESKPSPEFAKMIKDFFRWTREMV